MKKVIYSICFVFLMILPVFAAKNIYEIKRLNIDTKGEIINNLDAYTLKEEHSDIRKILSEDGLRMGFENSDGSVKIEPKFDNDSNIEYFDDEYLSVAINGIWGLIDKFGDWQIYPVSDMPIVFKNDAAVIKVNDKYGVVNIDGFVTIKPTFDIIEEFSEDLAAACKEGACGFIDKSGNWQIEPQFPMLVCWKQDSDGKYSRKSDCNYVSKFNGGMAPILYENINNISGYEGYYKSGYINTNGKIILKGFWNDIGEFSENLAAVPYHENKWGYINRAGDFVIPAKYEKAETFKNHFAKVFVIEQKTKRK